MTPDPLAVAALGLAVFGLPPGSKRAAPGWHGRCSTDLAAIAASWRPGDNIGVGCRASGVAVVDLDRHDGKPDGVATFRELLATARALASGRRVVPRFVPRAVAASGREQRIFGVHHRG